MLKIKDFLVPVAIGLSATWAMQYFFSSRETPSDSSTVTNRSFVAPRSQQIAEPLDFDVNFYDCNNKNKKVQEKLTILTTSYGELSFSNFGGTLANLAYNLKNNSNQAVVNIIQPNATKENNAFLIGLSGFGGTPYYYDLIENKKEDDKHKLSYIAESENAIITKQFTVYNDKPKLDLKLTLEPKNGKELRARIFLPGPISDNFKEDYNKAILYSEKNILDKKPLKDIELFGKELPTMFGLEDHYFANLLISDKDNFAKRAYFKIESTKKAISIFESAYIKDKSTWQLSFYCGPKDLNYLSQTDSRLTDLLEYGWFSFIAKPILYLLHIIYNIVKSYGLAIIFITIITRLLILPFTMKNEAYKRQNIEMQKKLRYIEQAYKHDPETLAKERLEVIKKYGVGIGTFLPLLVQVPIFIGLSKVINTAIELYKTPFLWIPDLSAPDPYYILPILFGAAIALQISQTSSSTQQRLISILMAIVIAAFSSNFSAGLALYIFLSTFLGIVQTYAQRKLKI